MYMFAKVLVLYVTWTLLFDMSMSFLQRYLSRYTIRTLKLCREHSFKPEKQIRQQFGNSMSKIIIRSSTVITSVLTSPYISNALDTATVESAKDVNTENTNVIKRLNDKRQYKAFTLPNQLRVLLISDKDSMTGAVALDVHVGSFSDRKDLPGLAHFCEHMLFLGTKRYPKEDEYSTYLSSHGGSSNAYTDSEDTVYYFDVNSDSLEPAIDRFAQFFIAPLFTPAATARELNAIDSEHAKNINDDGFRLYQLDKDIANKDHPLNQFATGNKDTLEKIPKSKKVDVRKALLDYHSQYYSANQMTLVIYGSQPINMLQSWTEKYFQGVVNKNTIAPSKAWQGTILPYLPQTEATMLQVVPINDIRRLSLSFPINLPTTTARDTLLHLKPEMILTHLIGHEGKGSIISGLKKRNWANSVQAGVGLDISDVQLLEINVESTEEGFKHTNDVIEIIFSYIQLLQSYINTKTLPLYIIKEVSQLSQISFQYAESSDPIDYVSSVVTDMQIYRNPEDYLIGSRLFPTPENDQIVKDIYSSIQNYIQNITPEQCRLKVVSRAYKGKTSKIQPYYGTEYNEISLVEETKYWSRTRTTPNKIDGIEGYPSIQLSLPPPNELIPTNFQLLAPPLPSTITDVDKLKILNSHPVLIRQDSKWNVWYKLDRSFSQPKAYVVTSLAIKEDKYDPVFAVSSQLFSSCFFDSFNEYLYDARLAGLSFQLDLATRGVQLTFTGYNDKLPLFVSTVLKALKSYQVDEKTFNRYKDAIRRDYASWNTRQPYYHSGYYATLLLESLQFDIDTLKTTLESITVDSLNNLMTKLVDESFGTALVMGNIDESTSLKLIQSIETSFPFKPLPREQRCVRNVYEIPSVSSYTTTTTNNNNDSPLSVNTAADKEGFRVRHEEPNENDVNSAVTFFYQEPSRDMKAYLMIELLSDVVEQPFYNSLRTQQQLGYIVYSGVKVRQCIYNLMFTAQSSIVDGDELTNRISTFLKTQMIPTLRKLSEEEFETFKEGLIVRKSEQDRRLTGQASRFWTEILVNDMLLTTTATYENNVNKLSATSSSAVDKSTVTSLLSERSKEGPDFDRYEHEISVLQQLTREEFIEYAINFLSPQNILKQSKSAQNTFSSETTNAKKESSRLLISQITSKQKVNTKSSASSDTKTSTSNYIDINDDNQFRQALKLIF